MNEFPGDETMVKPSAAAAIDITVQNRLVKEKRDINVYHHANRSAHIISSNSSLTRGIKPAEADDYLHISVVSGPGHLRHYCVLDLPAFLDFRFSLIGEATLLHQGGRTLLRIPPGPPTWELKMTIPSQSPFIRPRTEDYITVADDDQWPAQSPGET